MNHVEDYRLKNYREKELQFLYAALKEWKDKPDYVMKMIERAKRDGEDEAYLLWRIVRLWFNLPGEAKKILRDAEVYANEIKRIKEGKVK